MLSEPAQGSSSVLRLLGLGLGGTGRGRGCPATAVAADGQHIPLRTGLAAWALEAAPREHAVTGDAGR